MQKSLLLILLCSWFNLISFGQISDTIKGDLYFGIWRYGSFYKLPKRDVKNFEKFVVKYRGDTTDNGSQKMIHIYDVLKKENLLYHPYVQLKLENDSVIRLYLEKKDYKQIKKYKLQDLQDQGEKINILLRFKTLDYELIYCNELLLVKKIKGRTFEVPRKFAIEDYP